MLKHTVTCTTSACTSDGFLKLCPLCVESWVCVVWKHTVTCITSAWASDGYLKLCWHIHYSILFSPLRRTKFNRYPKLKRYPWCRCCSCVGVNHASASVCKSTPLTTGNTIGQESVSPSLSSVRSMDTARIEAWLLNEQVAKSSTFPPFRAHVGTCVCIQCVSVYVHACLCALVSAFWVLSLCCMM